jgi:hypothetical protein
MCVALAAEGMMTKFGKLLGKPKTSIWGWYHGKVMPSLNEMLKICYCVDIPLVDFITGVEKQLSGLRILRSFTDTCISSPSRAFVPVDYSKAKLQLLDVLDNVIPISMREAGNIVGINCHSLYEKFPKLCRAISRRYAAYKKAQFEKERRQLGDEVTEACVQLKAKGVYPSNRKIAEFLGKPAYLNRRDVNAIARAFRE